MSSLLGIFPFGLLPSFIWFVNNVQVFLRLIGILLCVLMDKRKPDIIFKFRNGEVEFNFALQTIISIDFVK